MKPDWLTRRGEVAPLLVSRIGEVLRPNPDGSFSVGTYGEDVLALDMLAKFAGDHRDVPQRQRYELLRTTVKELIVAGRLTPETVQEAYIQRQRQYLKQRPRRYVLVSSLSIPYVNSYQRIQWNGASISFSWKHPRKYRHPDWIAEQGGPPDRVPMEFTAVRVAVNARCEWSASENALRQLNLVRACWNLDHNRRWWQRMRGTSERPINRVLTGPVHTLHFPDGSLASDSYWSPPSPPPARSRSIRSEYVGMKKMEARVRRACENEKLADLITVGLIRYGEALDETTQEAAFLRLWGVLEHLTLTTGKETRHTDTVERASVLVASDRRYDAAVLDYLRESRNQLVHHGAGVEPFGVALAQLAKYVEGVLLYLIANSRAFDSEDMLREYLQLPSDPEKLRLGIDLRRFALGTVRRPARRGRR
jgi:hypothetical protein